MAVTPRVILWLTFIALSSSASIQALPWKPIKSYFGKLSPVEDDEKIMASHNRAGWAVTSHYFIGSHNAKWVGTFKIENQQPVWWLKGEHDLTAPIVNFGRFVVLGYRDGTVKKVDNTNGKVVWTAQLGSYVARPVILNGASLYAVTVRQQVYSLDFQTGTLKWFYEAGLPEEITVQGAASPIVHGDILYFGSSEGEIHAVNTQTGKLLWRKDPEYSLSRFMDIVGELFIHNNQLFLTRSDGVVAALKLGLGEPETAWVKKLPSITTSRIRNGRLYVGCLNGDVQAFEIVNGRQVWSYSSGDAVVSINVMQNNVVVLGAKGRISLLEIDKGKSRWIENLYGQFNDHPVIFDGHIYFFSGLNVVYGFKL